MVPTTTPRHTGGGDEDGQRRRGGCCACRGERRPERCRQASRGVHSAGVLESEQEGTRDALVLKRRPQPDTGHTVLADRRHDGALAGRADIAIRHAATGAPDREQDGGSIEDGIAEKTRERCRSHATSLAEEHPADDVRPRISGKAARTERLCRDEARGAARTRGGGDSQDAVPTTQTPATVAPAAPRPRRPDRPGSASRCLSGPGACRPRPAQGSGTGRSHRRWCARKPGRESSSSCRR